MYVTAMRLISLESNMIEHQVLVDGEKPQSSKVTVEKIIEVLSNPAVDLNMDYQENSKSEMIRVADSPSINVSGVNENKEVRKFNYH